MSIFDTFKNIEHNIESKRILDFRFLDFLV